MLIQKWTPAVNSKKQCSQESPPLHNCNWIRKKKTNHCFLKKNTIFLIVKDKSNTFKIDEVKEEQAKKRVYNGVSMKAFLLASWREQVLGIGNKSQKMAS